MKITADSFGPEIPANWQEIADFLNAIITEENSANDVWEAYWCGEYPDAPKPDLHQRL